MSPGACISLTSNRIGLTWRQIPYHAMYGPNMIQSINRSERELKDRHPVVDAFGQHEESVNFSRNECRETVIPAYMGLITELDDHIGRLMDFLKARGDLGEYNYRSD